jgi:O-Antigen ligase
VYPAALLLAVVLPFEAIPPVFASLSDEKVVLLLLAATWLLLGVRALPTRDEARALVPTVGLVLVALVSAMLAPDFGDEALRFVWRLAILVFVMLVSLRLARDPARASGLLWAIVVGGGLSAALGLAEALGWSTLEPLFKLFKVAPTRVGGELRVSASFQYATIAAMYFEMVAPLAIVLAATARRYWLRLTAVAVAALCTADVVLSLTRAGAVTLLVVYAILLGASLSSASWRRLREPTLVGLATLVGGSALLLVRNPVVDLRLVTESDADWYGAAYSAPAALEVASGGSTGVSLEVRNQGRITWVSSGPHPFALGYRWLSADGMQVLDVPLTEVTLPRDISPGESVQLQASVHVPNLPAGTYRIDWGMLQRDVLQFYERGWADAETRVQVGPSPDGAPASPPSMTLRDDGEAPWVVGRMYLWTAALHMVQLHPLLGVGPDNFRHFYGAELGLETWDERVQANNLYLEILADLGVLGLAAFAWVIARPLALSVRLFRSPAQQPADYLRLGAGAALVAFLVHGLADSFLAFTPTALLLWMMLGLLWGPLRGQNPQVSGR